MMYSRNMENKRYSICGLEFIAEYFPISPNTYPISDLSAIEETLPERRSAVVHNISRGGTCISTENPDLDVDMEVDLLLTMSDPESGDDLSMEFVAQVIWVSEDPSGFRAGLKFIEVPEDFPELFERFVTLLEKNHSAA